MSTSTQPKQEEKLNQPAGASGISQTHTLAEPSNKASHISGNATTERQRLEQQIAEKNKSLGNSPNAATQQLIQNEITVLQGKLKELPRLGGRSRKIRLKLKMKKKKRGKTLVRR